MALSEVINTSFQIILTRCRVNTTLKVAYRLSRLSVKVNLCSFCSGVSSIFCDFIQNGTMSRQVSGVLSSHTESLFFFLDMQLE